MNLANHIQRKQPGDVPYTLEQFLLLGQNFYLTIDGVRFAIDNSLYDTLVYGKDIGSSDYDNPIKVMFYRVEPNLPHIDIFTASKDIYSLHRLFVHLFRLVTDPSHFSLPELEALIRMAALEHHSMTNADYEAMVYEMEHCKICGIHVNATYDKRINAHNTCTGCEHHLDEIIDEGVD